MVGVFPSSSVRYTSSRANATMTTSHSLCSVCSEALEPHTEATCNNCGQLYHLNHRLDLPGKDCGQVWINEDHLALEFACNTCLHPEPGSLQDVLDLAEAAAAAGTTEAALSAAADAGRVPHRRTAGGIYLFQRSDLAPFRQGRR